MPHDITGVGVVVTFVASNTFPTGFTVSQFADDADPLDFAAIKIADSSMGLNGDLIKWGRSVSLPMVINVIPGSSDDLNLQILADANRVGRGKISARDKITATVVYPDGGVVTMTGGCITDAQFARGIASSGRQKTKMYGFSFEQKV